MEILQNSVYLKVVGLLIVSNTFMTFAWYGHLKNHREDTWWIVALISWGIALFEYLVMVPANRIGAGGGLSLAQLKITQEVITLMVFVPFSMMFMKEKFHWDFVWAGLCLVGAVIFIFRDKTA